MTHAEWDGREDPPEGMWRFARPERIAFLRWVGAFLFVVLVNGLFAPWLTGWVLILGPILGAMLAQTYANRARARAADPDGVLADMGHRARVRILRRGVDFGSDEGYAFVQRGLVCFHGRRLSFSVRPERVDGAGRIAYEGPAGEYVADLVFPDGGKTRVLARGGPAEAGAVEVLPPVRSGVRWSAEAGLGGTFLVTGAAFGIVALATGDHGLAVVLFLWAAVGLAALLYARRMRRG